MAINRLRIIADEQIPGVEELFGNVGELIRVSAREMTPQLLQDADILLVRSVTRVNERLLAKSKIQFVGTATAGLDHLDQNFLQNRNIRFIDAAGCNALAVAEYVLCCIASLNKQGFLLGNGMRAGVVGLGRVGRLVEQQLQKIGFDVIQNDPPRAKNETLFVSVDLQDWNNLDLICLHTPFTMSGDFPTYHLIKKDFLNRQKPGCVLINAGRGAVVDEQDLLLSQQIIACLDVWENEPDINLELLKHCKIATPHVAGYSIQAKYRAAWMLYDQARQWFDWPKKPLLVPNAVHKIQKDSWQKMALDCFDPVAYTQVFRKTLLENAKDSAQFFEKMRNSFLLRNEFLSV